MTPAEGWKRVVSETAVLAGVVCAAGFFAAPANPLLTGVALHPFVLVSVLIAARYGAFSGLGASAVLFALYELGGLLDASARALPTPLAYPHSLTASALIVAPLVVGGFLDSYREAAARLKAGALADAERMAALEKRAVALDSANRELRSRVLGESSTLHSLYDMAQRLSVLEPRDLYPAVLELLATHYEAERSSFYVVEEGGLRLVAQRGWESVSKEAAWVTKPEGILADALREGRLFSVKDQVSSQDGAGIDKVIAAPLRHPDDGRVVAVIAVDKMPFRRITPQTMDAVRLVAEWTSRSIANAELFMSAGSVSGERQRIISDLLRGLGSRTVSSRVVQQLASLGRDILPELARLLGHVNAHHHQRDNLLSLLENLLERGISLTGAEYSASVRETFRSWLRLDRYRTAARAVEPAASATFLAYLDERQGQLKRQADRTLVLYLAARQMRESAQTDEAVSSREDPVMTEFSALFAAISSGDADSTGRAAAERFGLAPAPLEKLAKELFTDPDHWIRATALQMAGLSGDKGLASSAVRCLRDPNPVVRETAVAALARLGGVQGDSIEELFEERAKMESDSGVRRVLEQALNELRLDRAVKSS